MSDPVKIGAAWMPENVWDAEDGIVTRSAISGRLEDRAHRTEQCWCLYLSDHRRVDTMTIFWFYFFNLLAVINVAIGVGTASDPRFGSKGAKAFTVTMSFGFAFLFYLAAGHHS